jgi:hypothetical protein
MSRSSEAKRLRLEGFEPPTYGSVGRHDTHDDVPLTAADTRTYAVTSIRFRRALFSIFYAVLCRFPNDLVTDSVTAFDSRLAWESRNGGFSHGLRTTLSAPVQQQSTGRRWEQADRHSRGPTSSLYLQRRWCLDATEARAGGAAPSAQAREAMQHPVPVGPRPEGALGDASGDVTGERNIASQRAFGVSDRSAQRTSGWLRVSM